MIKVTIEIWPHGDKDKAITLSEVNIINTLKNPRRPEWGDYKVEVFENDRMYKLDLVSHRRSEGFWPLIERVAKAVLLRKSVERLSQEGDE